MDGYGIIDVEYTNCDTLNLYYIGGISNSKPSGLGLKIVIKKLGDFPLPPQIEFGIWRDGNLHEQMTEDARKAEYKLRISEREDVIKSSIGKALVK